MSRPALTLSLQFADRSLKAMLPRHRVARCIRAALEHPAEITVRLVDADEGQALNHEFRGKDYPTNVLTFDYERGPPLVVADLVLCAPVLLAEAQALHKPVTEHAAHLLVHGTLHAQGWDHETSEADALAMEAREREVMCALGLPDPYAQSYAVAARSQRGQPPAAARGASQRPSRKSRL